MATYLSQGDQIYQMDLEFVKVADIQDNVFMREENWNNVTDRNNSSQLFPEQFFRKMSQNFKENTMTKPFFSAIAGLPPVTLLTKDYNTAL